MRFAYFPGCTARSSSAEYDKSARDVMHLLDIALEDIPDWNCCGASSAHAINRDLSLALPGRNISLAQKMGLDILTICPSCFLRHRVTEMALKRNQGAKESIERHIGTKLNASLSTKHILDILYHEVGLDALREKTQKSLRGLKAVAYYGCYLVRPHEITCFDDPENPQIMDSILEIFDAEIIDWGGKTDCCGGGLSISMPEITADMVEKIVLSAQEVGSDAIVTACPMCQISLDMFQPPNGTSHPMPAFYFSELTALALGSSHVEEYLSKHLINASTLLKSLNLL